MPKFGAESLGYLHELHPDLQKVLVEAIKIVDFKITCGHRGQKAQHAAFLSGASQLDWPHGQHNKTPSEAADVGVYYAEKHGINYSEREAQYMLVGMIKSVAWYLGIKLRCGADWNGDMSTKDQTFHDIWHIELLR